MITPAETAMRIIESVDAATMMVADSGFRAWVRARRDPIAMAVSQMVLQNASTLDNFLQATDRNPAAILPWIVDQWLADTGRVENGEVSTIYS